jgi:ABC-type multidrug transport system ATPase subunit/sugar lactone lactonase YvrE
MMNTSLWKLEKVTLSGRSRPRLLDVSLEIPPGVTAILGHSGAGKTSLLNLLVGFERPDRGTITGEFKQNGDQLPLFWAPPGDGLWPHLTVGQHVRAALPLSVCGGDSEAKIAELLGVFNLSDKMDEFPDQLSQGESARTALVRALASQARVLVLDEPLVHVETAGSRKYWERLRLFFGQASRLAVVFSTHSPEVVLREASQVICLSEGRVVYAGSVEQLYYDPGSPELAWCLGPANWVGDQVAPDWLEGHSAGRRCYRPEEVGVSAAESSSLVVQSAAFSGSVAEVELLDERSGQTRRVFHRPVAARLRAGQRVLLKVMLLLFAALLLAGCTQASAEPQLAVRTVNSWIIPAEGSKFPKPRAVHVGLQQELFVLDNVGRVLVYDPDGQLLRQWWMPDYSVGKPEKICQFRSGRLAVADTHYHRVVFFDPAGHELSRMGSLGREPGQFIYPVAVVEDDDENYYVCEYGTNDRVQKFDKDGNFLLQFGSFGTGKGQFQRPSGIVWRDHKVYVVDAFNSRIQVFSDAGEFLEILADGDDSAALNYPYDIAVNEAGELYVAEYGAGRVSKFDRKGHLLGRFGTIGSDEGQFSTPWGIAADRKSRVYVADTGNFRVVELRF